MVAHVNIMDNLLPSRRTPFGKDNPMAQMTARIKREGQITIPVELRRDLELEEGELVAFRRTERGIEIVRPTDVVHMTAGVFADYAKNVPTDPSELRRRIAESIAEEVAGEIEAP